MYVELVHHSKRKTLFQIINIMIHILRVQYFRNYSTEKIIQIYILGEKLTNNITHH